MLTQQGNVAQFKPQHSSSISIMGLEALLGICVPNDHFNQITGTGRLGLSCGIIYVAPCEEL